MATRAPAHFNCFDNRNTWFWYGDEGFEPQAHNYVFEPPLQSWRRQQWNFSLVTSSRHFAGLRGSTPPAPDILELAPAVEGDVAFLEELGAMMRTPDAKGELPSLEAVTASEGDEGVHPCLLRWRPASSADVPKPLDAERLFAELGLNPVIAEESRSYIDFKGRSFSSKEEERKASKTLLNWGTHHEFMYGDGIGAEAAWEALNYHPTTADSAEGDGASEERDYMQQAAATWLPILRRLAAFVIDEHLLVVTCGSQRLLNPIPCFCLGESASGNLVGFATALVYT